MSLDVTELRAFYASPLGEVAQRLVGRSVHRMLGSVSGLRVMGLGYAVPYIERFKADTERTFAFMPAGQGAVNWPVGDLSSTALVFEEELPLPDSSIDRILMVHMYHEIEQPYEFLWRMRPSLKPDGEVIVVDANRRTQNHGTPPNLLECEFAAVGYKLVSLDDMPSAGGYLARFKAVGPRPEPKDIRACRLVPPPVAAPTAS